MILSERDNKIKSLEEKLKEFKVRVFLVLWGSILLEYCVVTAGEECVWRIQCLSVTRTA